MIDVDGNAGVASIALAVSAPPASGAAGGGPAPSGSGAGAGAGGGDQQGGGDVPSAGSAGVAAFTAALTATAIQAQKDVLRSGVVVSCRTNRRATCVLRIELAGKDARRLGLARSARKPVVIARGTVRTEAGKPRVARLRLTKAAASKLRRAARVSVVVVGEAASTAGDRSTFSRSILVRRR